MGRERGHPMQPQSEPGNTSPRPDQLTKGLQYHPRDPQSFVYTFFLYLRSTDVRFDVDLVKYLVLLGMLLNRRSPMQHSNLRISSRLQCSL
ncbi:hypothetical protein BDM02DRAFT_3119123 [Thelephora ganbajun]|uniref:Uncharacterized protein n=1 Tax=Thelephora ganbajun TaxID=370292 RepID=A0ACB6Z8P6_THEGA|nr:hypothetical protein BDM02DRAFT_3119123 [Thelephora ganbajun]